MTPDNTNITARWLVANALACITSGLTSLAADGSKRLILASVDEPFRIAFMAAAMALGFTAWAYFVATVPRNKVPGFPLRTWIVAHAIGGLTLGGFVEWLGESDEPLSAEDSMEWILMSGMLAAGGAVLMALVGLFHALILRGVARGLGAWIGYSALAGLSAVLFMPFWVFGPQTGFRYAVKMEASAFVFGIIWALVMLSALRRLMPRET